MPCERCGHTMQRLGLETDCVWWCPRCGSLKERRGAMEVFTEPKLVDAARLVAIQLTGVPNHGESPAFLALCEACGPTP